MIEKSGRLYVSAFDTIVGGSPVQEFIARENIRRFEAQLAACSSNPAQRETLSRLLAAERQHLADALAEKRAHP